MVIYIVCRIERGQGQPGEGGRKVATAKGLPKHAAPLDVIVAIEVATTNRLSRELKSPEYDADRDGAGTELNSAQYTLGLQNDGKMQRRFHLPANCSLNLTVVREDRGRHEDRLA